MTGKLSLSKPFGHIPVDGIFGRVHLVSTNVAVEMMGAHVFREKNDSLFAGSAKWSRRTFYLHRFPGSRLNHMTCHLKTTYLVFEF